MPDLLLEIGTEELPAGAIAPALEFLERHLLDALSAEKLDEHLLARSFGTPRRLAVLLTGVRERQAESESRLSGPALAVAFDAQGKPTKAAEGFARKLGIPVEALVVEGGRVVGVQRTGGGTALALLPALLARAVAAIPFRKSMRWGNESVTFARPVQWLLALLDQQLVPFTYGTVASGRTTHGHRFHAPAPIALTAPANYLGLLAEARVLADPQVRRARVAEEISRAAAQAAPGAHPIEDPELLDQVTNLVEWPVAVLGRFDPALLSLPREVLVSEMRGHQRYFPVVAPGGALLPCFVAVSNTDARDHAVLCRGYERVLRARLADARFFYDEDRKKDFARLGEGLQRVVFHARLGSVAHKVTRLTRLAARMAEKVPGLSAVVVERAARLCKNDLLTGMVGEFPELQGIMGGYYARAAGEEEPVAAAIAQHYQPRGAGDALPESASGALLAIADKLDTLCGFFAVGLVPTGAADPFGLRRACIGVIRILDQRGWSLPLHALLDEAFGEYERQEITFDRPAAAKALLEFFRGRLRVLWTDAGSPADLAEAVLSALRSADESLDLVDARVRLAALLSLRGSPDFHTVAATFKRVSNILRQAREKEIAITALHAGRLTEAAERALADALARAPQLPNSPHLEHYAQVLSFLCNLRPAVDRLFDEVMVMAGDPVVRDNRLALLHAVASLFAPIADFGRLQGD